MSCVVVLQVIPLPDLTSPWPGSPPCPSLPPRPSPSPAHHSAPPPALPSVLINVRTSVHSVVVGHSVEFECLALGDPKPQVTWSKVGGHLRPGIVQSGSIIRIAHVELADAGQYRCAATNAAGTTQSHVLLLVQGRDIEGLWKGPGRDRTLKVLPAPWCYVTHSCASLGISLGPYLRDSFPSQ